MSKTIGEYRLNAYNLFFEKIEDIVITRSYSAGWLRELRKRGYKVYLLSNYPEELFKLHEKQRFDFIHDVDGMGVSGFVKMIKPEPEIYQYILNHYELNPEECIFLDDK